MSTTQKKSTDKPIRFQIKGIELLNFLLDHPKQKVPAQMIFNFDVKLEHKLLATNNLIAVIVTIDINDEHKTNKLGSIMASCLFDVPELQNYIDKKTNLPKLPGPFLTTINSISISTVRGLMFSQFKGTFLHYAILPVIDPKSFANQK